MKRRFRVKGYGPARFRTAWALVLCVLLFLGGCAEQPVPQEAPQPEIQETPPQVVEVPLQVLKPMELEILLPPRWKGSEPQEGDPITPQPGDTAASWDPNRAKDYPADQDCTAEEFLEKWLTVEGLSFEDLEERDCRQLIVTAAQQNKTETLTTCYTRQKDGAWAAESHLTAMEGYVGKNGIAHNRRRGTETSPAGLWPMGSAFGLEEAPEDLRVPWRDITPNSDWVTDSRSIYFNTWQECNDPALTGTWRSAEHLADYKQTYTYACVIEYNTPPYTVPNRGCAIFLHVSDHPTEGCIGLLTEDMVAVLQWLDPHQQPHILITGNE